MSPSSLQHRSIDVLVVDDSAVVRQALKETIEAEPTYRVLIAADPYEAVAVMSRTTPRVIVLDVDMPRMDGITFLRKLMRQHPLPVLLVTDHPARGVEALSIGALEVIAKPDWRDPGELAAWATRLRASLRTAIDRGESRAMTEPSIASEAKHTADAVLPRREYQKRGAPDVPIVAVGASTGGVQAVTRLLELMPSGMPGIVIVQHMRDGFTPFFADQLSRNPKVAVEVRLAAHGEVVRDGVALVVPEGRHGVVRRASGHYWLELMDGPPVCRHRPSVDVLFRSVAMAAGPWAAGVILTGMLDDGADGLLEIREAGGFTIAQDEATSLVFGMPKEAIRRGAAKQILALDSIAGAVSTWSQRVRA